MAALATAGVGPAGKFSFLEGPDEVPRSGATEYEFDDYHYTSFPPPRGETDHRHGVGALGGGLWLLGWRNGPRHHPQASGNRGAVAVALSEAASLASVSTTFAAPSSPSPPPPRGENNEREGQEEEGEGSGHQGPASGLPQQLWRGLSETILHLAVWMHRAHEEHVLRHAVFVGDHQGTLLPVVDEGDDAAAAAARTKNKGYCRAPVVLDPAGALLADSYPSLDLTIPGSGSSASSASGQEELVVVDDDDNDASSTSTSSSMSLSSSDSDEEDDTSDEESSRDEANRNHDSDDYFGDFEHDVSSGVEDDDDDDNEDNDMGQGGHDGKVADLTSTSFSSDEEQDDDDEEEKEIHRLARLYRERHGILVPWAAVPSGPMSMTKEGHASWGGIGLDAARFPPRSRRQQRRRRRQRGSRPKATDSAVATAAAAASDRRKSGPVSSTHQRRVAASHPRPRSSKIVVTQAALKAAAADARESPAAVGPAAAATALQLHMGVRPPIDHSYLYISDPEDSDCDDYDYDNNNNDYAPHLGDRDGDGVKNIPCVKKSGGAAQIEFLTRIQNRQQQEHQHHASRHSHPPACFWPALLTWFQRPPQSPLVVVPTFTDPMPR